MATPKLSVVETGEKMYKTMNVKGIMERMDAIDHGSAYWKPEHLHS